MATIQHSALDTGFTWTHSDLLRPSRVVERPHNDLSSPPLFDIVDFGVMGTGFMQGAWTPAVDGFSALLLAIYRVFKGMPLSEKEAGAIMFVLCACIRLAHVGGRSHPCLRDKERQAQPKYR